MVQVAVAIGRRHRAMSSGDCYFILAVGKIPSDFNDEKSDRS